MQNLSDIQKQIEQQFAQLSVNQSLKIESNPHINKKISKLGMNFICVPGDDVISFDETVKNGTRVVGAFYINTYDTASNEGFSVFANNAALVFWDKRPKDNLIVIPAKKITGYCGNELNDDSLELTFHSLNFIFETIQLADEFASLSLTESGANFLLALESGKFVELLLLEVQYG